MTWVKPAPSLWAATPLQGLMDRIESILESLSRAWQALAGAAEAEIADESGAEFVQQESTSTPSEAQTVVTSIETDGTPEGTQTVVAQSTTEPTQVTQGEPQPALQSPRSAQTQQIAMAETEVKIPKIVETSAYGIEDPGLNLAGLDDPWQAKLWYFSSASGVAESELTADSILALNPEMEIDGSPSQRRTLRKYVVSPDAAKLFLASIDLLGRQPQLDPDSFQPEAGVRFNDDDSVTIRVLVGNEAERLTLIGDFNEWGQQGDLNGYRLQPASDNPMVHEITLPPGDYHKMQYRLVDHNGRQRLDLHAELFATPAFNERFYAGGRPGHELNAVLWKPQPIPAEEKAERPDLRGTPLVIAETDIVSLSLKWVCDDPQSAFYGQLGAGNIDHLYQFVTECGLAEKLEDMGYNAVQFMPLDTHVDFWEPRAPYFPDWRYSYQTINFYGKHADFGSPDELRRMINAFHKADLAVLLDVVYSHFPSQGNEFPRDFEGVGYAQYKQEDGNGLYGGPWTEWGTRRFTYTPQVRRDIIDAALKNILDYGFDGLRIDNVNGIDAQPNGRTFLRELSESVMLYHPQAVLIAEGYFGDPYLNRALSVGGAGMATTYSDRYYLWFTEALLKHREEVDTWRLDYMLFNDWPRSLLYYPGNHDEFANPGNAFQARGRYLVDAIDGGDFHNRKIQSWSALGMFASSYFLDMPQLWTMQTGNLNSNAAIDWSRERNDTVAQVLRLQRDMKEFYTTERAFAPYNIHSHMLHWIDHENKVVTFERIDFANDKRVYVTVNLGDEALTHYQIPVHPEEASFRLALDSDRSQYGGQDHNPQLIHADEHNLEFFLGSYGVVAAVQEDNLVPSQQSPGLIMIAGPKGPYESVFAQQDAGTPIAMTEQEDSTQG